MKARLLLLLAVGLLPAADKPKDDACEKDAEALLGRWRIVSHQVNGETSAENAKGLGTILFAKDKITIWRNGNAGTAYPYQIKPGKDPKEIDVLVPEAMLEDARYLGIYSIEKDQLKICLAVSFGEDRSKDFTLKRGYEVFVLKRSMCW